MDMQRFSEILKAYGGNPRHWPMYEREAALQVLQCSLEAKNLQREALLLDRLLNAAPMPEISSALQKRILKATQPPVYKRILSLLTFEQPLKFASVFAISCLVAFVVWNVMPTSSLFSPSKIDLAQEHSANALGEEEELIIVAFSL